MMFLTKQDSKSPNQEKRPRVSDVIPHCLATSPLSETYLLTTFIPLNLKGADDVPKGKYSTRTLTPSTGQS